MEEGGGDFGYYDPDLDDAIDNDDHDEQEVDTTRPLHPGATSTPYYRGEQYEMQTMQHEQSGLPHTSYEGIPLLSDERNAELEKRLAKLRENSTTGLIDTTKIPNARVNPLSEEDKEEQIKRVKKLIKARYPNANVDRLVIRYSTKNPMDLVVKGPRGGETKIVLADGSDLQKSFTAASFIKKELGDPAEDVIKKTSDDIKKKTKRITRFTKFTEIFKR